MFLKAFLWPPLCRVNLLVNEKWLEIRRRARRFLSTPNGEILGLAVGASFFGERRYVVDLLLWVPGRMHAV